MMVSKTFLQLLLILGIGMGGINAFVSPTNLGVTTTTSHTSVLLASSSSSSFVGPVQETVERTLRDEFEPAYLQVINESHGQLQDESHFKVIIVSAAFESQRLVQRHRLVNSSLMSDDGQLPFHALTITAKTPEEWDSDSSVPQSPACMGGH